MSACIEPFDIGQEVGDSQNILVVQATLTDELKRHQILITRSLDLESVNKLGIPPYDPNTPMRPIDTLITYEQNASVSIVDNLGNNYPFSEAQPGLYISTSDFAAQNGIEYTLNIDTQDGTNYRSRPERFTSTAVLEDVRAERNRNAEGVEGLTLYVDGRGNDTDAKYYRYTYDETYKIIAPEWKPEDFKLTNYDPCALPQITYDLEIIERDESEGKVCYNTVGSTDIIQGSTVEFRENSIAHFPIRFIDRNNFIITHRYSILVRQYVQTQEAYGYYQALNDFSASESIFSDVQPGFLDGNISIVGDDEKKVLGYFEVASVDEKRIFFNYEDFFPNEPLPDYPVACFVTSAPLEHVSYCFTGEVANPCPLSIVEAVNAGGLIAYYGLNDENIGACPGPYLVTYRACGDCTELGESEVPDFWIE
ncbi:DUF4249 domain-containing protein [Maribacter algicola]|uniref:DUF4249 domain-containing protein n=1 Tax=Meishania litoralis TaxID=3434685 RepID=A0ACC7LJR7_9FLAO